MILSHRKMSRGTFGAPLGPDTVLNKIPNSPNNRRQKSELEKDFKRLLDRSWLHQLLSLSFTSLDRKYPCLGEGRQFRAWRLPLSPVAGLEPQLRRSSIPGSLGLRQEYLVLKKPTPDFLRNKREFHLWRGLLPKLTGAWSETLIPPFYGISLDISCGQGLKDGLSDGDGNGGAFGIVMPFGIKMVDEGSLLEHNFALQNLAAQTDLWLQTRGLELADTLQVRWCQGIPFLVDLGDIRARKS